jgi:hypothetical protein
MQGKAVDIVSLPDPRNGICSGKNPMYMTEQHVPPEGKIWAPSNEEEREAVRLQLERILKHPLFAHSQRYPALLRYVVEQALAGTVDHIKERTIGVLVFGRSPSYDANADPVVRITAGEIRKRLTRYYAEAEHTAEIRIVLPVGSYVPQLIQSGTTQEEYRQIEAVERAEQQLSNTARPKHIERVRFGRLNRLPAQPLIVIGSVVLLVASFGALQWKHTVRDARSEFWKIITDSSGPIAMCIEPARLPQTAITGEMVQTSDAHSVQISKEEVESLLRIASALPGTEGRIHIFPANSTSFEVLRSGPIVLIADGDTSWTERLTAHLRFAVMTTPDKLAIVDRTSASAKSWFVPIGVSDTQVARSYALIARYRDHTIGQPAVIVAGIGPGGTAAGIQTVSDASLLASFLNHIPNGCSGKNLEMVVGAEVVDNSSGEPYLLATECW